MHSLQHRCRILWSRHLCQRPALYSSPRWHLYRHLRHLSRQQCQLHLYLEVPGGNSPSQREVFIPPLRRSSRILSSVARFRPSGNLRPMRSRSGAGPKMVAGWHLPHLTRAFWPRGPRDSRLGTGMPRTGPGGGTPGLEAALGTSSLACAPRMARGTVIRSGTRTLQFPRCEGDEVPQLLGTSQAPSNHPSIHPSSHSSNRA